MRRWCYALAVVLVAHGSLIRAENATAAAEEQKPCKCVPYYTCPEVDASDERNKNDESIQCENFLEVCCKSPHSVSRRQLAPSRPSMKKGCGYRNPYGVGASGRRVTDNEARFGEFPWVVAVMTSEKPAQGGHSSTQTENTSKCGGSLIHPKVVLTGAHCVSGKEANQVKIRAGEWNILDDDEPIAAQERYVERIVAHEDFNGGNLFNDVALLVLSKSVNPAENIGFACLPDQEYSPAPGAWCYATGWGKDVSDDENRSQGILKKIGVPVVANPDCQDALRNTILGKHFKLHQSFMCAGGEEGKDACKGDGGNPLLCPLPEKQEVFVQSGIVAWGIGCGKDETPGVYASVAFFRNWIDEEMHRLQLDTSYYSYSRNLGISRNIKS
ncbi:phenoloxidase-activating factor 2-like [Ischnura elegans]|uniref:phenoloxidase-activating factor 2-like n=1 Tax=Ischnura elegans TaxID=197161 RepID=UPI001ED89B9E|nr:phenoloxidase-activating factor 2-like [Ischnura elegans]